MIRSHLLLPSFFLGSLLLGGLNQNLLSTSTKSFTGDPSDTLKNVTIDFFVDSLAPEDSSWIRDVLVNNAASGGTQDEWYITLDDYHKLNAKVDFMVYTVHDGTCNSGYLLTLVNREPMFEELVEQFCETDLTFTKSFQTEYKKLDVNAYLVTRRKEVVNDSCAVDSNGHYLDGMNLHNVETRIDSSVKILTVNSNGWIVKTKPEPAPDKAASLTKKP